MIDLPNNFETWGKKDKYDWVFHFGIRFLSSFKSHHVKPPALMSALTLI